MTSAQFEHIVAVMPDAVIVTNPDGIILFANAAARDLFGEDAGELVGSLAGFSPAQSEASEIEVVRGNERRTAEVRAVRCNWDGRPALLSIVRDNTEQRQASDQLRQAQKMEAIGTLTGSIAHDFNNLLLVMLIYAEMVRGECAEDDRRLPDIVEVIRAIERAQALTRQLLAFSKKNPAQPTTVHLSDVVTGLEPTLRSTLPPNIEIMTRFAEASWSVLVDQGQIEQAILNLAVNAADAMPRGGRFTLEIETRSLARSNRSALHGDYVALLVTDNGSGIDPAHLDRIFEPFFTTKERGRGTGLGLATCYAIVAQARGMISVESSPGRGTKFTVLLPRARDDVAEKPTDEKAAARKGGGETILVVEDDAAVMRATVNILQAQGYTVMTATNGDDACRVLHDKSEEINLVLSDMVMPQLDGLELEKILAQKWPQLPLIFMTGYSEQPVVQQDGGMWIENRPTLMKPFRGPALLRIVRDTLDQERTAP